MLKAVTVESGGMISCAIDEEGTLWAWGSCPQSQSSDLEESSGCSVTKVPTIVPGLKVGSRVMKVSCGNEHIVALLQLMTGAGDIACYAWGDNKYGQLGLGHKHSVSTPQPVAGMVAARVNPDTQIACGAFHTVIVTSCTNETSESLDPVSSGSESRSCDCWTCGLGENGQLGHGIVSRSVLLPQLVEGLPRTERIVAVACGLFHTTVELDSGNIWVWGMKGGWGLCPGIFADEGDALVPIERFSKRILFQGIAGDSYSGKCDYRLNERSRSSAPKSLVCGAAHTVTLACHGLVLWAWGRGQQGALGTGQYLDSWVPCQVNWPPAIDSGSNMFSEESKQEHHASDVMLPISAQATENPKGSDARYAQALQQIHGLRGQLASLQGYADMLEYAMYGRAPQTGTFQRSGESRSSDHAERVVRDWEQTIERTNIEDLAHLDDFYRRMRSKVKDALLWRKTEHWCKLFLGPTHQGQLRSPPPATLLQAHTALNTAGTTSQVTSAPPSESYSFEEFSALSQRLRSL